MLVNRRWVAAGGIAAPLFGVTAAPSLAQDPRRQPETPLPPAEAEPAVPGQPEAATNLDTTDSETSHVLAPVMVNGKGPYQFLVDTGANRSAIAAKLAEELGLPAGPPVRLHTVAGSKARPTVVIDELKVGDRVQRRLRVPALPISGIVADGILGVDWLKNRRLVFDMKADTLNITPSMNEALSPDDPVDRSAVVVPARLRSGQITIVDADLSGRKISAMIDTGSQLSMGNTALRQMVASFQQPGDAVPIDMITVTGDRLRGELFYVPFIRLGGLLLGNVGVVFAPVHVFTLWKMEREPALILGMDLLRQFDRVALDFGRARVRFDLA